MALRSMPVTQMTKIIERDEIESEK